MAPPVKKSQSWGGHPAVMAEAKSPEVLPSSETMAPSGSNAPTAAATARTLSSPVGRSGREPPANRAASGRAPTSSASASRVVVTSSAGPASTWISQFSGTSELGRSG